MKTFILALSAAALMAGTFTVSTEASAKSLRKGEHSYAHSNYHRLSKRQRDRLPISYTRPPNTSHYIFQGFPKWAAHAFQPRDNR